MLSYPKYEAHHVDLECQILHLFSFLVLQAENAPIELIVIQVVLGKHTLDYLKKHTPWDGFGKLFREYNLLRIEAPFFRYKEMLLYTPQFWSGLW